MRRAAVEHKSVPEMQAEERALLRALKDQGDSGVVLAPNGLNGTLAVTQPTEEAPSAWARDLAEAVGTVQTEADCGALIDRIEEALGLRFITTRESGRLLAAVAGVAVERGWLGPSGLRALEALLRARLGPAPRG